MIEQWLQHNIGKPIEASGGKELRVDCPFCEAIVGKADGGQHLYVSMTGPVAHCFRCGWQGNYISLVMSVNGCTYADALLQLADAKPNVAGFGKVYSPRGLAHTTTNVPDGYRALAGWSKVEGLERTAVMRYLLSRQGVTRPLISKHFGTVAGTNRAWVLIDKNYWQGRLITAGEPRYVNPPWPKGDAIWNWQALQMYLEIIICEGVFSAIAAGPNAVAVLGKEVTGEQVQRLVRANRVKYIIMLDKGAEAAAEKLADDLKFAGHTGAIVVHYLDVGQPDDGVAGESVVWGWDAKIAAGLQ